MVVNIYKDLFFFSNDESIIELSFQDLCGEIRYEKTLEMRS